MTLYLRNPQASTGRCRRQARLSGAGALAGVAAPVVGSVLWVASMIALRSQDFPLQLNWTATAIAGLVGYLAAVAIVAVFIAGIPGAAFGAVGGLLIGDRPITLPIVLGTSAVACVTALSIAVFPQIGLDVPPTDLVGLGLAAAIGGAVSVGLFDYLRDQQPDRSQEPAPSAEIKQSRAT